MERTCYRCKKVKNIELFGKDKSKPAGHSYKCKECYAEKSRNSKNKRIRAWKKKGIVFSVAEYEKMLTEQGGLCWICREPSDRTLQVDHCHATGKVRGILCYKCNWAIGAFNDDPVRIARVVEYLGRKT